MTLVGFEHRIEAIGGVRIHAVVGGRGSPVVLLHGFPQTWWAWRYVMPALAERHTVAAADLRGAGFSDCPQGGYDKVTLAADVHGLMSLLGHQHYAVVGHDVGAMVAHALASMHRDAVSHLAVLGAPVPGWSGWEEASGRFWHFGFHQQRDLPEMLIRGREYDYVSAFMAERMANHGAFDPAEIEVFARALAMPGRLRGAMEWYRAYPADHQAALSWKSEPLAMPVLALGGDRRFGSEMVGMMREFAADVRGSVVADSSHYLVEDRPAEVIDALRMFLA